MSESAVRGELTRALESIEYQREVKLVLLQGVGDLRHNLQSIG